MPLDGIRALAVTAVILSHAEPGWAVGGFFGVDVFFVLSGYLITTILLSEWRSTGGIDLPAFWARRARRLLPALGLLLVAVGVASVIRPSAVASPGLVGDTLATVGYAANWHFIAAHANYFAASNNPSPLLHTWSLAIEEQFYLIWPLVLIAILTVRSGRRSGHPESSDQHRPGRRSAPCESNQQHRRRLAIVAVITAAGAILSATWMAILTTVGGAGVDRLYYGSDTRAQDLLFGAALAAACQWWGPIRTVRGRRTLMAAGLAGAVGVASMCRMVPEGSALTFRGGFALLALCTAAVIASVTQTPSHPLTRLLSVRPLPYLGRISYGMYLWYWPVLLVMTAGRTHLQGWTLLLARGSVIVALAAVSFHLVETPIRRGAVAGWRGWASLPAAAAAVVVLPVLVPSAGASVVTTSTAGSPPLTPASAAAAPPMPLPPVRILLVGDSVVGSLGVGLSSVAPHFGAEIVNRGSPGCSLAEGNRVRVLWYAGLPGKPCRSEDPGNLLQAYRGWVARFDPDVVVYLARSDTLDTELDGKWQHLGQPSLDRWAESRFRAAASVLASGGARVVFLTSPFYDSGEQGNGQPWPENAPGRVVTDNRLLYQAARDDTARATVFDLGALLSPAGRFATSIDGVNVRCQDGVHLTVNGGEWVAARLLPDLVSLGRARAAHTSTAATGARTSLSPEPPPSWYGKLPCGSR
jgi:peptidoglycan/LPS O-acetylase OafA/YrhL